MNIKTLRKNYAELTMLERLSLVDNAKARDDENEISAIVAASPRETYRQTDFYNLMQEINKFRLCNLIARLGYIMLFDLFLQFDSEENEKTDEARLAAFCYVRATDSWKTLNDELGLRPDFDAEIGEHLFAIGVLKRKDSLLRDFAFNENEAREFIKGETGNGKIITSEDEIKTIREALELPDK
ncbi:MAG: hypothetical protein ACR2J3_11240 [Aridibacter sp.]